MENNDMKKHIIKNFKKFKKAYKNLEDKKEYILSYLKTSMNGQETEIYNVRKGDKNLEFFVCKYDSKTGKVMNKKNWVELPNEDLIKVNNSLDSRLKQIKQYE